MKDVTLLLVIYPGASPASSSLYRGVDTLYPVTCTESQAPRVPGHFAMISGAPTASGSSGLYSAGRCSCLETF